MTTADASPSAAHDDRPWFYKTDAGKSGPVGLAELSGRIASGELSVETPVWRHGLDSWLPAVAFEELKQAVAANRSTAASRSGSRRGVPAPVLTALLGITAAIVAWQCLAWLCGLMAVAQVSGTVTAASRPVTGGSVILSPIAADKNEVPGKPGVAAITPDGRFSLRIAPGSRGLAKRFAVRFSPPVLPPMAEEEAMKTVPPYFGFVPKQGEVAIRAGANAIDIEIVPSSRE